MATPSVTLKSLKNGETGIDIVVPGIIEEEAPLGGISVLFEICINTTLDLFKSSLHNDADVVQFSVFKAYREIEDLYGKLNKKYPEANLPQIPKSSATDKCSTSEKLAAVNKLMLTIAIDTLLSQSAIFTHFIGINSQKSRVATSSSSCTGNSTKLVTKDINSTDDLSDVFPKVKNTVVKAENKFSEKTETQTEIVDLFEEVKTEKDTFSDNLKGKTSGLFDDFEDESLFSTKPTPKPASVKESEKTATVIPVKKKEPGKTVDTVVDDSQIIIKERKLGEISLFDEQDLGDYITKEEESLFLVTPENEKSKKNVLLFSSKSEPDEIHTDVLENLDDLLNLNPLPVSPAPKTPDLPKSVDLKPKDEKMAVEITEKTNVQPKKPVPLPRKKSIGKSDSDESSMAKPEVMPRKVFLKKPPEVPVKPASAKVPKSTKPPISEKPAVLPKPKLPIKGSQSTLSKDIRNLDALNANKPANASKSEDAVSTLTDDLNKLDILKYIEQEQKISEAEPSLFD